MKVWEMDGRVAHPAFLWEDGVYVESLFSFFFLFFFKVNHQLACTDTEEEKNNYVI